MLHYKRDREGKNGSHLCGDRLMSLMDNIFRFEGEEGSVDLLFENVHKVHM